MKKRYKAIGLMSGSSLDGVDIAFCHFELGQDAQQNLIIEDWSLQVAETIPFPEKWHNRLLNLPTQNALTFAKTHTYLGHFLGEIVNDFIQTHKVYPDLIASHGHTIFHEPNNRMTIQIGDGAAIAATTGYTTITNFRNQDIAIDGEGTPVAPIVDQYVFKGHDFYLNIGGIANISCVLPNRVVAFDISPANQLLNVLANRLGYEYDEDGKIAASGTIDETLLKFFNHASFYGQSYPKSLANSWVTEHLLPHIANDPELIPIQMATGVEHIAYQIAQSIQQIIKKEGLQQDAYSMLATGGGAFNSFLMERLQSYCDTLNVQVVLPEGPTIQFKEAILMAWMGVLRMEGVPNVLKTVTGGQRDTIGGAVYAGRTRIDRIN